jgi:8-oxo-dGTP pyrophosphatase MutT (NUDIX family)
MLSKRQVVSCGIVIVRLEDEPQYLMLRSYNAFDPGPKGKMEQGESNLEAAKRECFEETGISPAELDFKWGQEFVETEPYGKLHKINRWFVAEVKRKELELPINPELGHAEHNEYRWLNYEEASKLLNARLQRVLSWAKEKVDG